MIVRLLSSNIDQFNALTNSSYSYKLVLRENVKNHKSQNHAELLGGFKVLYLGCPKCCHCNHKARSFT